MKTISKLIGLAFFTLVLTFCSTAKGQFGGFFAPGNWGTLNNSDEFVDWSGAPATLKVYGGNDGSNNFGFIDVSITSNVSGTVSFNWSYNSEDPSETDEALFISNSVYFPLSSTSGSSGFVSFSINAGERIGFSVETEDNLGGRGELTITNFSVVPEPSAITLAGIVCVATGFRRRRAGSSIREHLVGMLDD